MLRFFFACAQPARVACRRLFLLWKRPFSRVCSGRAGAGMAARRELGAALDGWRLQSSAASLTLKFLVIRSAGGANRLSWH